MNGYGIEVTDGPDDPKRERSAEIVESGPDDKQKKADLAERPDEPPVIARMIVEIRSDGTRTIARGAIEEATTGERVAIEAHGTTPLALATSLAKSMFSAPMLAKQAVRALLAGRKKREE